jgi:hypothetical protein
MQGVVFYNGPSQIDGKPVIGVATFVSKNQKTGPMIQTWIMRRGISPTRAISIGADASVCGNCPARGKIITRDGRLTNVGRWCYVTVRNAPTQVWQAFRRGRYAEFDPEQHARLFTGRTLRLGSYGDPVAVPLEAWEPLLTLCCGHSGYTHQWRDCNPSWAKYLMASVDSPEERAEAKALGFRTFRTRKRGEKRAVREIACPASPEGGMRLTCNACLACHGSGTGADVTIEAHGSRPVMANYQRFSLPVLAM